MRKTAANVYRPTTMYSLVAATREYASSDFSGRYAIFGREHDEVFVVFSKYDEERMCGSRTSSVCVRGFSDTELGDRISRLGTNVLRSCLKLVKFRNQLTPVFICNEYGSIRVFKIVENPEHINWSRLGILDLDGALEHGLIMKILEKLDKLEEQNSKAK